MNQKELYNPIEDKITIYYDLESGETVILIEQPNDCKHGYNADLGLINRLTDIVGEGIIEKTIVMRPFRANNCIGWIAWPAGKGE